MRPQRAVAVDYDFETTFASVSDSNAAPPAIHHPRHVFETTFASVSDSNPISQPLIARAFL